MSNYRRTKLDVGSGRFLVILAAFEVLTALSLLQIPDPLYGRDWEYIAVLGATSFLTAFGGVALAAGRRRAVVSAGVLQLACATPFLFPTGPRSFVAAFVSAMGLLLLARAAGLFQGPP